MALRDPSTYKDLTFQELLDELAAVNILRSGLKECATVLNGRIEELRATEEMKVKVSNMSPAQRAALAQIIRPEGIASEERMGVPGAQ